ncbi:MAG: transcription antitermination factor NusB [Gammaproteobacteria bacterium]|nr:transcription antitermination factor NusB [Gammaproteobacteria bacterium]MDH4314817.1 transcription antitermination factor NusB [Gammaproteobacteria bacterium]MDH5213092.1 transcription antitermination factor NusB [Gammaproteobacteria bacterium]MDH5499864.1 transcription antitermination factor NusB [Gammaproteobacteria bacterium]
MSKAALSGARSRARELIVQALYQLQLTGHSVNELVEQFQERPEYNRVDRPYFDEVIAAICANRATLESTIGKYIDRPLDQLDPVEFGILLLGVHELEAMPDVPFRVVINEAVNLAKRFGSVDGHKYINAVLDRAVPELRAAGAR